MGCRVFKGGIQNKVVLNENFCILLIDFVPRCQKVLKSDLKKVNFQYQEPTDFFSISLGDGLYFWHFVKTSTFETL